MQSPTPLTGRDTSSVLRVLLGLLTLGALGGWTAPATAHAEVERSTPAADSVVAQPPTVVEVWFSEEPDPTRTSLVVVGPEGARVDLGDSAVDLFDPERRHVTVSLRSGLTAGAYTVHWRSGSATDDDEAFGSFAFTLLIGAPGCATGTEGATPVASPAPAACVQQPPTGALDSPIAVEGTTVELRAGATKAGPVDLTVLLEDADGAPVVDARVTVRARHLEMDHGEFPKAAVAVEPGRYLAEGVGMGMGGEWRVAVDVLRPGRLPVTLFVPVDLTGLS